MATAPGRDVGCLPLKQRDDATMAASWNWMHPDLAWFIGSLWHRFDESDDLPAEQAYLRNCAPRRRQEFIGCRYFARILLESLGSESTAIARGERGEPIWPTDFVGSISHTGSACFIAVGPAARFESVGVDIDTNVDLDPGIVEQICTRKEIQGLESAIGLTVPVSLSKLLFCAKESIFKCMYPVTGEYWEFNWVEVSIDPVDCSFVASLAPGQSPKRGARLDHLIGRFYHDADHILCLCYLGR